MRFEEQLELWPQNDEKRFWINGKIQKNSLPLGLHKMHFQAGIISRYGQVFILVGGTRPLRARQSRERDSGLMHAICSAPKLRATHAKWMPNGSSLIENYLSICLSIWQTQSLGLNNCKTFSNDLNELELDSRC